MRSSYNAPRLVGKATTMPRPPRAIPPRAIPTHVAAEIRTMITAIGRLDAQLASCGLGWSDVAAAIPGQLGLPWEEAPSPSPSDAKSEDAKAELVRWIKPDELLATIAEIERRSPSSLGGRSRAFLQGLRELAADYPVVRLSPKQSNWLDGLAADAGLIAAEAGPP